MDELTPAEIASEATPLVAAIKPILAGHNPVAQGCALAELLAIWLAGHQMAEQQQLHELRQRLLLAHIETVLKMVPLVEAELGLA